MADAARLAGVTPSAPYRHFKDREALMAELRRRAAALFGARLAAAATGGATPQEGFSAMGGAYLDFARQEPGYYAALFAFRGAPKGEATGEGPAEGAFGTLVEALARAGAGPKGEADGAPPRLLALQIWALSHGLAGLERAGLLGPGNGAPDGPPLAEEVLRDAARRLIRGG